MAFWTRFKRENKKWEPHAALKNVIMPEPNTGVIVCFNRADVAIKEIEFMVSEKFGAASILQIDNSRPSVTHLMLQIDGIKVMCSYMPFPMPRDEGDIPELLHNNYYVSAEEQMALMEHKSFCMIAEIGGGTDLTGKRHVCLMITKLCGALLRLQGAAGVYCSAAHLLLGRKFYLNYAEMTHQTQGDESYFPSVLWVAVYPAYTDDGVPTIETCGLTQFGFLELEFFRPTEDWSDSYEKLYIMSTLQITGREVYRNMDMISFTQDDPSVFKQNGGKLTVIGGI